MKNQKISDELLSRLREQIFSLVEKGKYQKALRLAEQNLAKFGKHRVLLHSYASLLGDYAEFTSDEKKMKLMACEIYRPLLKSLNGLNEDYKHAIRNEYYYHSYQFKKQYQLGQKCKKVAKTKRLYSMGVGAANYAYQLRSRGEIKRSQSWAREAIDIWKKYLAISNKYYNPYVHLSLANGIVGDEKSMEVNLLKASKISGQPLRFREFQEVRDKISNLKS